MIKTTAIKLRDHLPLLVTWDMLRRCNFDCTYCGSSRHDTYSPLPGLEELKNTFDFIYKYTELYNSKRTKYTTTNIDFTGGEPTANPAFWPLIDYIKTHDNMFLGITTNGSWGTQFTQRILDSFKHVTISWHAEAPEHLKARTIENIQTLFEHGVDLQVNVMLHCDYFEEAKQLSESLKSQGINVNPTPIGDGTIVRKGWFIDTDGTNRRTSHEYTVEQQNWFFDFIGQTKPATTVSEGTNIGRACCGGRCTEGLVEGEWQPVKLVDNWFKDWYCTINWYFLHIEQPSGNVFHHQTCQATHTGIGPIGNLSDTELILNNTAKMLNQANIAPIICPNQRCGCGMCVPKAKNFDNFKQLWAQSVSVPIQEM
jgi:MoaA/NifB/PqqE/SkfB family radical SAM enzyme